MCGVIVSTSGKRFPQKRNDVVTAPVPSADTASRRGPRTPSRRPEYLTETSLLESAGPRDRVQLLRYRCVYTIKSRVHAFNVLGRANTNTYINVRTRSRLT